MIELSGTDALRDTGSDPNEVPADVEANPDNYGNPYDDMIGLMRQQEILLNRIANFSERQREKLAPDIIDLSPAGGLQIPGTYQMQTALRLIGFVISGGMGDMFRFGVGGRTWTIWSITGAPVFVPWPYTVQRGQDLTVADVTTPASVAWSFTFFGYPE